MHRYISCVCVVQKKQRIYSFCVAYAFHQTRMSLGSVKMLETTGLVDVVWVEVAESCESCGKTSIARSVVSLGNN